MEQDEARPIERGEYSDIVDVSKGLVSVTGSHYFPPVLRHDDKHRVDEALLFHNVVT